MSILTPPSAPEFASQKFRLRSNTLFNRSPLTRSIQSVAIPGAAWEAECVLPPVIDPDEAAAWRAFFVTLRGQEGRFYMGDRGAKTARGVATGAPAVKGASQTGTSLLTDGWTHNVTGILKVGDYFSFDSTTGRELKMVVATVNADSAGEATLVFEPPIRVAPADDAVLTVASPTCKMMLADDSVEWDNQLAQIRGFAFGAIEAFP